MYGVVAIHARLLVSCKSMFVYKIVCRFISRFISRFVSRFWLHPGLSWQFDIAA